MRRQFVAVVAASVISAGMTMNAMASGHAGLRHGLGYGLLDLHTKLSATGTAGMDRPTGYTEVSTALSAAGVWALVLAFWIRRQILLALVSRLRCVWPVTGSTSVPGQLLSPTANPYSGNSRLWFTFKPSSRLTHGRFGSRSRGAHKPEPVTAVADRCPPARDGLFGHEGRSRTCCGVF